MRIDYDPAKNATNIRDRALPFDRAADFDFATALITVDNRKAYPEVRYLAIGYLDGRLHSLCFTLRGDALRVISFRKSNPREGDRYAKK